MHRPGQAARVIATAVVVLAALALVALAARSGRTETVRPVTASGTPTIPTGTRSPVTVTPKAEAEVDGRDSQPDPPLWLLLITIAMALALGLGLWTVAPRGRPRPFRRRLSQPPPTTRPEEAVPRTDPTALTAAVEAGLQRLDTGEPADAVVACWVLLERAAAAAGSGRELPETPSELAGRLIDVHDVPAGPLLRLAELYREARYSRHELPEAARADARAALEQVRAALPVRIPERR